MSRRPRSARRWPVPLSCCLLVWLLAGCRGGAAVPRGWSEVRPSPGESHWIAAGPPSRLQVLLHYDAVRSTHVTLRVTTPGLAPVFWDPGGAYGLTRPSYGRRHDVILAQPPDLPTWWRYRVTWLREPLMLVFEWDLPADQTRRMHRALMHGAEHGREAQAFRTLRSPGMCNFAVAEFLRRYASPPVSRRLASSLMPDTLAGQLWDQRPDRVLKFTGGIDDPPLVLRPPSHAEFAPRRGPDRRSAGVTVR